jgi:hypothetical protein
MAVDVFLRQTIAAYRSSKFDGSVRPGSNLRSEELWPLRASIAQGFDPRRRTSGEIQLRFRTRCDFPRLFFRYIVSKSELSESYTGRVAECTS